MRLEIYSNVVIDTTTGTGVACHIVRRTELIRIKNGIESYKTTDWFSNPIDNDYDATTPDVVMPIIRFGKPYEKRFTIVSYDQSTLNAMDVAYAPHVPNGLSREYEKLWKIQHALWMDSRGKTYDVNGNEIDTIDGSYMNTLESIWIKR